MIEKTYKKSHRKERSFCPAKDEGFTLVEILMVIVVLGIIASLLLSVFYALADWRALEREAAEIKAYLEEARIYTQASRHASSHGVYFGDEEMELFRGESWAEKEESIRAHRLSGSISIIMDDLGGESEIVFFRLFGEPSVFGDIVVAGPRRELVITLLSSGLVE